MDFSLSRNIIEILAGYARTDGFNLGSTLSTKSFTSCAVVYQQVAVPRYKGRWISSADDLEMLELPIFGLMGLFAEPGLQAIRFGHVIIGIIVNMHHRRGIMPVKQ